MALEWIKLVIRSALIHKDLHKTTLSLRQHNLSFSSFFFSDNNNIFYQQLIRTCQTVLGTIYFHHNIYFITTTWYYYCIFIDEESEENCWVTCSGESSQKRKGWDLDSYLSFSKLPTGFRYISNSRSSRALYFIISSVGVDSTASQTFICTRTPEDLPKTQAVI